VNPREISLVFDVRFGIYAQSVIYLSFYLRTVNISIYVNRVFFVSRIDINHNSYTLDDDSFTRMFCNIYYFSLLPFKFQDEDFKLKFERSVEHFVEFYLIDVISPRCHRSRPTT